MCYFELKVGDNCDPIILLPEWSVILPRPWQHTYENKGNKYLDLYICTLDAIVSECFNVSLIPRISTTFITSRGDDFSSLHKIFLTSLKIFFLKKLNLYLNVTLHNF